jgi:hypothetical protein
MFLLSALFEPFNERRHTLLYYKVTDFNSMENAISCIVNSHLLDRARRTVVNTPDARQYVIAHELIENLTIQNKVFARFDINQRVVDYQVCISATH